MKKTLQDLFKAINDNLPEITFEVSYWDGETNIYGLGEPVFILMFRTEAAAKMLLAKGALGFGEEYVAGNIEVAGDFQELVHLGMDPRIQTMRLPLSTKASFLFQRLTTLNTVKRSKGNIAHHYDLGNDFYKQYLDESMTYSCAYFRSDKDTLEQAQQQKYEHICRKLCLKEGESLLDIGCGWGGMLRYAARHYGVKGVGCTLSRNQAEYGQERAAQEGLDKSVTILCEDYRNIKGPFDKFVSIGMFEHVGKRFIPTFIEKTSALLKPGGIGLLHTIGKELDAVQDPWTMKYIFPGAHLPALHRVVRIMGRKGLVPVDIENLRLHYAATLDEWATRFERNLENIRRMTDEQFIRMWRFYLYGSSASFRWGDIRLYQVLFTKGLNNTMPMTREHLYLS